MSWLDDIGHFIGGGLAAATDIGTDILHGITGVPTADAKRNASKAMNAQISAYKEQTAITKQQIAEAKESQTTEKRKIDEKQIRSLRRNNRPQGILSAGSAQTPQYDPGMSPKLGG